MYKLTESATETDC